MKAKLGTVSVAVGLILLGCGCSKTPGGAVGATTATAAPLTTTQDSSVEATTTPLQTTATRSPTSWVMPNLVGQDLQAAQDAVQALTDHAVFFTSSTDATGQGRAQIVDANWKVCSQNISPGDTITATTKIEFAAVKLNERCP